MKRPEIISPPELVAKSDASIETAIRRLAQITASIHPPENRAERLQDERNLARVIRKAKAR